MARRPVLHRQKQCSRVLRPNGNAVHIINVIIIIINLIYSLFAPLAFCGA